MRENYLLQLRSTAPLPRFFFTPRRSSSSSGARAHNRPISIVPAREKPIVGADFPRFDSAAPRRLLYTRYSLRIYDLRMRGAGLSDPSRETRPREKKKRPRRNYTYYLIGIPICKKKQLQNSTGKLISPPGYTPSL